jgi:hypothetical protein
MFALGEACLAQGELGRAEALLAQSVDAFRAQGADMWHLRALDVLGRVRQLADEGFPAGDVSPKVFPWKNP